jgi:hypothetical protein
MTVPAISPALGKNGHGNTENHTIGITYVPDRPAGTGSKLWATLAISSGPVIVSSVISDANTPGAIEFTRTGIPLRAISVASILVRWAAAAFELLYANLVLTANIGQWRLYVYRCTHMSLSNLQNSTYASNVDNTRCVTFDILAALVEQTEKGCCHVVDRESIDLVQRSPCIWAVIIEERIPEGLSVGIFRPLRIVKEIRKRP